VNAKPVTSVEKWVFISKLSGKQICRRPQSKILIDLDDSQVHAMRREERDREREMGGE
jgi:hypothetical protein